MITTAEGVETEEQMRCLNFEGSHRRSQGDLYSEPVPASKIVDLLRSLTDRWSIGKGFRLSQERDSANQRVGSWTGFTLRERHSSGIRS